VPSLTPPSMTPEVPSALSPLVRRVVADNPSHMTGPGTNTYLVGVDEVAVIDPGPASKRHTDAIIGGAERDRIRWIVLTHTHPDHAPGATRLAKATGAEIWGYSKREKSVRVDRALADGDTIDGTEFRLEVLHTPGHAPNHLCFFLDEERMLFTGDTILGGMFSVVSPSTGGDMADYIATLERLRRIRRLRAIAPGHGEVIAEPRAKLDEYLKHRRDRERQVLKLVQRGPTRVKDIVATLYVDTPDPLLPVAAKQVYAHLKKLQAEGKVSGRDQRSYWTAA
jgi:glyoxylase-like metal-dependent hydrolase (beta-lactamase superfamily II)